jgi:hypothetical protein
VISSGPLWPGPRSAGATPASRPPSDHHRIRPAPRRRPTWPGWASRSRSSCPRMTPLTDVGRPAVQAYAARSGQTEAEYVAQLGPPLTPEMAGRRWSTCCTLTPSPPHTCSPAPGCSGSPVDHRAAPPAGPAGAPTAREDNGRAHTHPAHHSRPPEPGEPGSGAGAARRVRDRRPRPGIEIACSLGDVSHGVYTDVSHGVYTSALARRTRRAAVRRVLSRPGQHGDGDALRPSDRSAQQAAGRLFAVREEWGGRPPGGVRVRHPRARRRPVIALLRAPGALDPGRGRRGGEAGPGGPRGGASSVKAAVRPIGSRVRGRGRRRTRRVGRPVCPRSCQQVG